MHIAQGGPGIQTCTWGWGGGVMPAGWKKFRTLKFSESFGQRYQILALRLDIKTQKCENLT